MAPAGINTCYDYSDIMRFSSGYAPISTHFKTEFSSSLSLLPISTSLPGLSSTLSSIYSDHDYGMKPTVNTEEYSDYGMKPTVNTEEYSNNTKDIDHCCLSEHYNFNIDGDAMLSSCAFDCDKVPGEGTDTDFLKELDDLNFSFDDLDPCCEVAMEDSFQDFIDSALEQSYASVPCVISNDQQARDQEPVILNKEEFLATLNLRSTQEHQTNFEIWSPSSTSVLHGSSFSSNSPLDEIPLDRTSHTISQLNTSSFDAVPTRQCSCIELESVFKSVYSTAHTPYQECVRICPSTMTNNMNSNLNNNKDYSQKNRLLEIHMAPLFIDTSSSELSKSVQISPEDCEDFPIENKMPTRLDRAKADIMKWLSESQQDDQQQCNDNNNNVISMACVNGASTVAETSHQGSTVVPSLDLESYIDIEDFELETADRDKIQQIDIDCTCERTADTSKHRNTNIPSITGSHLKFSFLTEHMHFRDKFRQGSYSDVFSESSVPDKLSTRSSELSYCGFSPAWSVTDSSQTLVSPLPSASCDLLFSSRFEDAMDDDSVTSPLDLLNLFSDENAASLLHTDSTVPNFRLM